VEFAVHAHSRFVEIATVPLPPDAGTLNSVDPRLTGQRCTVEGAVDVEVEDPQPALARAIPSATMSPALRFVMVARLSSFG
jgi:hypothetical protein